jgi:uncharacterized protein RhaS with RHS repeats
MYLSQDPIGIEGGFALYGHVHDPNDWLDIFGLNRNSKDAKGEYEIYIVYDKDPAKHKDAKPLKVGKAKSEDVMTSPGYAGKNRRAHTSERLARKKGYSDATVVTYKKLGTTTSGKAARVEAKIVRILRNQGNALPLNKEKDKRYTSCKKN